jgi:hypothetical protein
MKRKNKLNVSLILWIVAIVITSICFWFIFSILSGKDECSFEFICSNAIDDDTCTFSMPIDGKIHKFSITQFSSICINDGDFN